MNFGSDTYIEGLTLFELEAASEINALEVKAARPEAEASDIRWEQAERVVFYLERGITQERMASMWKRADGTTYSRVHVALVKKTWETNCYLGNNRPPWNEAYHSDQVRKRGEANRKQLRARNAQLTLGLEPPEGPARTIVVDPPWDAPGGGDVYERGGPPYALQSDEEIADLPIADIGTTDAHLYLWITNLALPHGFDLIDGWGFKYATCLTWVKPSYGMGYYYRGQTEHILFAVRGSLPLLRQDVGTVLEAPRGGAHSAKPDRFYEQVESCSPGPWMDLYARRERPGWLTWGAEV